MSKERTLVLAALLLACATVTAARSHAEGFENATKASRDIRLAFVRPGLIREMLVKLGDTVRKGDVLVRLDDRAERLQLAGLELKAKDRTAIEFAEASLVMAEENLARSEKAGRGNALTSKELDQADLEVELEAAKLKIQKLEHEILQLNCREMKARIDQMQIRSPIDGKVEEIYLREGEGADGLEDVIRVIRTDPLWVDLDVGVAQAAGLRIGQTAEVEFAVTDGDGGRLVSSGDKAIGKIIFKSSEVSQGKLNVRLEVPNPTDRPIAESVAVRFLAPVDANAGGGKPTGGTADGALTSRFRRAGAPAGWRQWISRLGPAALAMAREASGAGRLAAR